MIENLRMIFGVVNVFFLSRGLAIRHSYQSKIKDLLILFRKRERGRRKNIPYSVGSGMVFLIGSNLKQHIPFEF